MELSGTGFTGVQEVRFGLSDGSILHVLSPTSLRITSPPGILGFAQVVVVTDHGNSAPLPYAYLFVTRQPLPPPGPCVGNVCPQSAPGGRVWGSGIVRAG